VSARARERRSSEQAARKHKGDEYEKSEREGKIIYMKIYEE
jgi:hypothetical protein